MRTAIFPGSFDPVTLGHVDLICRAACLADRLIVGLLVNPDKQGYFSLEERQAMIARALPNLSNVSVLPFEGLLADFARAQGASLLVRGVRGAQDLQYEMDMAWANARLCDGLETILLPARPQLASISSSLVRQIARFGGDLSAFVPASAVDEITRRFYNGDNTATTGGSSHVKK